MATDVPVSLATMKLSIPAKIISEIAVWRSEYMTTVSGSFASVAATLNESPVLVFEFLEAGHQGGVHTPEFAAPFVKCGGTDAVFPAEFRDRATTFCLLEYGDDLAV